MRTTLIRTRANAVKVPIVRLTWESACALRAVAISPPPQPTRAQPEKADVVLCQDSAAAHLAVACGSALVCLTGPTNPHRTGPYGRLEDVQRIDIPCAPCYFRRLSQCGYNHQCMQDLTTSRVVAALRESLEFAVVSER